MCPIMNHSLLPTQPAPIQTDTILDMPVTDWLRQAEDRQLGYEEYRDWIWEESVRIYYGARGMMNLA